MSGNNMQKCYIEKLEGIFERANREFIEKNRKLFEAEVSERTLCGALMIALHESLKTTEFAAYYVDVEYNRNIGGEIKTTQKTIKGLEERSIKINCDLIVHSRGEKREHDNLIALEMKKSHRRKVDKDKDRERLKCLTKRSKRNRESKDNGIRREHVCGYGLGIYYELDFKKKEILIEYYKAGECYKTDEISLEKN